MTIELHKENEDVSFTKPLSFFYHYNKPSTNAALAKAKAELVARAEAEAAARGLPKPDPKSVPDPDPREHVRFSAHVKGRCLIVTDVVCQVPTATRLQKTQPYAIVAGKTSRVTVQDGVVTFY